MRVGFEWTLRVRKSTAGGETTWLAVAKQKMLELVTGERGSSERNGKY